MTPPATPIAALLAPFPAVGGIARVMSHPALCIPVEEWPDEAFETQEACGIQWEWADILRFLGKVSRQGACLIWTGAKSRGQGNQQWYGSYAVKGKTVRAHKFSAVSILGLRPAPGQEIDHGCHHTGCISCLRALPRAVNQALIRRPTKRILDLARFCESTPAEIMLLNEEQLSSLENFVALAKVRMGDGPWLASPRNNPHIIPDGLYWLRKPH